MSPFHSAQRPVEHHMCSSHLYTHGIFIYIYIYIYEFRVEGAPPAGEPISMFFRIETRRRAARKPGFQPGKVVAQHTPNFLLHGFWATRRSSVLGVWAAPSGQESIQDMGVGRPRAAMKPLKAIFSQGFRDPVGVVRGRFWAGLGEPADDLGAQRACGPPTMLVWGEGRSNETCGSLPNR